MPSATLPRPIPRSGFRDLAPATAMGFATLTILAAAYLQPSSKQGQYLVVAPPDWTLARTINLVILADGRMVRTGRFGNMLFAASSQPDFSATVRSAGAWFVLPAPALWGCGDTGKGDRT